MSTVNSTGEKSKCCPYRIACLDGTEVACPFRTNDPGSLTRHKKRIHGYKPKPRAPKGGRRAVATNPVPPPTRTSRRYNPYAAPLPVPLEPMYTLPELTDSGSSSPSNRSWSSFDTDSVGPHTVRNEVIDLTAAAAPYTSGPHYASDVLRQDYSGTGSTSGPSGSGGLAGPFVPTQYEEKFAPSTDLDTHLFDNYTMKELLKSPDLSKQSSKTTAVKKSGDPEGLDAPLMPKWLWEDTTGAQDFTYPSLARPPYGNQYNLGVSSTPLPPPVPSSLRYSYYPYAATAPTYTNARLLPPMPSDPSGIYPSPHIVPFAPPAWPAAFSQLAAADQYYWSQLNTM